MKERRKGKKREDPPHTMAPATLPYLHPNDVPERFDTISSIFQACRSFKQAKQIHAFILRSNLQSEDLLYAKLLLFCTSSSSTSSPSSSSTTALDYARLVFEQLQDKPTIFMWNTMIRGYANINSPMRAISLYTCMKERGVQPNNYTFTFLIKACTTTTNGGVVGHAVHAQCIVFGIPDSDVHVYTSLLNMYVAQDNVETARRLFDRMKCRTAATWNSMIAGYTRRGDVRNARHLFDYLPDKNVEGQLFDQMPVKSLPTWNAMIAGYTKASRPAEALTLFRQMQLAGVKPNGITLVSLLPSCAQLGALELGEWLHHYAERNNYDFKNITVCNAIIDMYAKCGCIDKAKSVFNNMSERSLVSWNTLISGLAIHGRGDEAIELFEKMETNGIKPDDITFVGLLNACAHVGYVERAWSYFEAMQTEYKMKPKIEHYGCMVDVLGRTRRLDEALRLIDSMPMEPNSVVLGSLLSACRICDNSKLGEKVLEKLVQLAPSNPGYYVLLSNTYASAGRWKDVTRVRNLMRSRGVGKIPGCSSIEHNNVVHEFVVGDKTHPMTREIYNKLDEISRRLEFAGYVPDTSIVLFDLDEEEKAYNLSVHSEKLAVAFGLLNTSKGEVIRVVKNLRVCRDCHSAIRIISQVYGREIVVRDRNRFHHFKDGCCSCKEFW